MFNFVKSIGFENLTDAQEQLIPVIRQGKSAILISPTGSGKTESAIFPIFDYIINNEVKPITALFITPLRALNRDILYRLKEYGKTIGVRVQVRHSDISEAERREIRDKPAEILITTPESVQILLNSKKIKEYLKNLKYVIVDELHELAQNERGTQLSIALERLWELNHDIQRIGLSATIGNPKELSKFLYNEGTVEILQTNLIKTMEFSIVIPKKSPEEISSKMGCEPEYAGAITMIHDLIESHEGTLVFVNTRSVAEDIAFRLSLYYGNMSVMVHHGSLSRDTREEAESKFKKNEIKGLICTSSLELGIDIGSADLVIQFNSPRQINKLIQRIGRSGHWIHKISRGIILCGDLIEMEEAMAIVGQINDHVLEPVFIREKSYATLANQIILRSHQLRRFDTDIFYNLIKRSYPMRNVSREEYDSVIDFLNVTKRIRIAGKDILPSYSSLDYFIGNISMIPSEKTYRVVDAINRKFVGTLDERYVLSEIEPGSYFVMRGSTWRTIKLDEQTIFVEPFRTAALTPKWSGEDIPVLPDVTIRVSLNRENKIVDESVDKRSRSEMENWLQKDLALRNKVYVENQGQEILIQLLLGTKGNFALSEILGSLLTSITGESVETDYSPYHIYMRTGKKIKPKEMIEIIRQLKNHDLYILIENTVRRSRFFNGIFTYEARKFGVLSKDADLTRMKIDKIIESYKNTILFEDSVRKMINDYMDIKEVENFIDNLDNIEFIEREKFSAGSEQFLSHYSERITPLKPTKAIIDSIRDRLLNEEMTLICTKCLWTHSDRVKNIKSIKCEACGSNMVAAVSPFTKDSLKESIDRNKLTAREKNSLNKSIHILRERGNMALMTMAGRGIGPEIATRLLSVRYFNDDDLIVEIIKHESDYAKNRKFWN
jgi:ATP-dependent Lhr-like helicase